MTNNSLTILGAGTMGAGIAQVAATAGWTVELKDVNEDVCRTAIDGIRQRLDRLVEKQRLTAEQRDAISGRLGVATCDDCIAPSALIIEAIVENLDVKTNVLRELIPALSDDCIIATNTSSLSVTALGDALDQPHRTVGMHFFNPAPLMKLVEVIAGKRTDPAVADRVASIASGWGKQVARAADVPGFIVNHVARPYYLEAFRILEDGYADPATIDAAMKTHAGFRMGPLELTDLIGQDVNTATTRSVWNQLDQPPLLHPSALQEQLVADGALGRKTKRGVYDHTADPPAVALSITPVAPDFTAELQSAVDAFTAALGITDAPALERSIVARIIIALIAQAALAHQRGVASKADINTALRYGVNYPHGPFEWVAMAGESACLHLLAALNATVDDDRFNLTSL
jgi:3-hydroxybutyryl-CoA dehydrogenase